MFLSFMNYFAIQCFPDTYNLVREGPNIDPYVMDLMVHAKKFLGHEGRCVIQWLKSTKLIQVITKGPVTKFPNQLYPIHLKITKI